MIKKYLLGFLSVLIILLFFGGFLCGTLFARKYFNELTSRNDRTNFLLLGMNGGGNAGDDLTDTIIFVSLNQKTSQATMISIPRDLWIKGLETKANSLYHYGGIDLAKKNIEEILGQRIDYTAILSFDGFEKVIDALGGVEVEVLRGFDDYKYPVKGKENDPCGGDKEYRCRYEHIHFEAGIQKMDGKTALKYVRSRNAEGEEGTDFARSQRQLQLLASIKRTLVDLKLYKDPGKILNIVRTLKEAIKTDVKENQYGSLLLLLAKIDWNQVKTASIKENLLINPKSHYSKQWVLIPKSGDWKEIRAFTEDLLK